MKVSTWFFLYTHVTVSLKDISKTGIAGHGLCTFSTLLGTAVASHVVVPVCTPARSGWAFPAPQPCPYLAEVFILAHLMSVAVVTRDTFDWHSSNHEWGLSSFHMLIGHLCFFSCEGLLITCTSGTHSLSLLPSSLLLSLWFIRVLKSNFLISTPYQSSVLQTCFSTPFLSCYFILSLVIQEGFNLNVLQYVTPFLYDSYFYSLV